MSGDAVLADALRALAAQEGVGVGLSPGCFEIVGLGGAPWARAPRLPRNRRSTTSQVTHKT
ncbi:hypothetical protein ACIPJN_28815 [Streptomyces sp. NPDC086796]|uniref:hypothetical protein n=1 Tax=Streptomyces sp. NPDC086796 TaxID=3365760 RepID=UPI003803540F